MRKSFQLLGIRPMSNAMPSRGMVRRPTCHRDGRRAPKPFPGSRLRCRCRHYLKDALPLKLPAPCARPAAELSGTSASAHAGRALYGARIAQVYRDSPEHWGLSRRNRSVGRGSSLICASSVGRKQKQSHELYVPHISSPSYGSAFVGRRVGGHRTARLCGVVDSFSRGDLLEAIAR